MRFAWERESDEGFCTITATPEDYDGHPPIQVLTMDYIPRLVANDRLAASCLLGFGYYSSGAVNLMSPVSAELANAATRVFRDRVVIPSVNYVPKAITYGSNVFRLNLDAGRNLQLQWNGFGTPREFELQMVALEGTFSSSFSDEVLRLPTNAAMVVSRDAAAEERILPYIAQAVLMAEDLDVGRIMLPPGMVRSPKLNNVAQLLQTCGLMLQFTE